MVFLFAMQSILILRGFGFLFFQKFEKKYNRELQSKSLSHTSQFEYAWCLVRSNYANDMRSVSIYRRVGCFWYIRISVYKGKDIAIRTLSRYLF